MGKDLAKVRTTIYFCDGGSCRKAGSEQVVRAARAYLRNKGWWQSTHTIRTRCNGRCEDAPTCIVQTGNYWYKELSTEKIERIIGAHVEQEQPLVEDLIFMEGMEQVQSAKERPPIVPKPFQLKEDVLWGSCWMTKGFSSDQYLYPLFLFLKEHAQKSQLSLPNGQVYWFKNLHAVKYTHDYYLCLDFGVEQLLLTIGMLPKTEPLEVQQQKISATTYWVQVETGAKKICFKNKLGIVLAELELSQEEPLVWDYLLNIQLQGLKNPIL